MKNSQTEIKHNLVIEAVPGLEIKIMLLKADARPKKIPGAFAAANGISRSGF